MENSSDNHEKMQAMELSKTTQLEKIGLLSDATTIDSALNYIKNKQEQRPQQQKEQDDNASATVAEAELDTETQTVF